jgi:WD40 repeat protein
MLVWDLDTGAAVVDVPTERIRSDGMAFDLGSTAPAWVALSEAGDVVQLYTLPDGRPWRTLPRRPGRCRLACAPDGSMLAIASYTEETIDIVDVDGDGTPRRTIMTPAGLRDLDWSDDGQLLAGALDESRIYVWSAERGEVVTTLVGHQAVVVQVDFAVGSHLLASYAWDNTVRLWDVDRGEPLLGPLRNAWLSGFADRLVTRGERGAGLWRVEPGHEYRMLEWIEPFAGPPDVSFGTDGRLVVTASRNGVHLWDARTATHLAAATDEASRGAGLTPDGRALVAAVAGELRLWPVTGAGADVELREPRTLADYGAIESMSLSPDGRSAISIVPDTIRLHDLVDGTDQEIPAFHGVATIPAVSGDGRWLFVGTWKGEPAQVIDLETMETVLELPGSHVRGRFSADGRWLAASTGREVTLYETGSWTLRHELLRDNADDLAGALAFDRRTGVLAACHSRFVVRLIDPESGRTLASLESPDGLAVTALALDPDGARLAAVTGTSVSHLWDLSMIREQLRPLGLDWEDPERPAGP